ncbi:hypothetical protein CLOM_g17786 [Closterium sp. NIES-68]|nr:hypothetical protein CLOM_g17786 [Closterium sp. NIES-68]GJP62269.1 hypothetical protein CLOP_g19354 [Closterium sp. NIES-67]
MGTSGPLPDSLGLVLTDVCAPVAAAASGASSFPAPVISFPLGQTGWVEHSGWWLNKRLLETDGLVACSEDEVGYLEGLLNVTPEMTGGDDGTSYDEDADTGTEGSVDGGAVGGGVAGDGDSSSSGGVQDGTGLGGSTGAGGSTGSGGSTGTEGDGISGSAMAARSSSSSSSSNGMWETPPGGDSAGNSLDETFYQETTTKPLGRRLLSTRRHLALGALKEQLETAWKNLGDKLRGSLPRKNGSAGSAAGAGAAAGAAAGAGSAAESAVTYQILVSSKQSGAAWGGVLEGEKLPDLVI